MPRSIFAAAPLLIVACAGPVGPVGAEGAEGPPGQSGSTGRPGTPGSDGLASLIEVRDEPPGPNCPAGGALVLAGIDADGDGGLSESEISTSRFVCDQSADDFAAECALFIDPLATVVIESDGDKFPLNRCSLVNNLVIRGPQIRTLTGLEGLQQISRLSIENTSSLTDLSGLSGALSIFNGFSVSGDVGQLSLGGMDSLVELADISIRDTNLRSLEGLPEIQLLRSGLSVVNADSITSLSGLESLSAIGTSDFPQNGGVSIANNDALIDMSALDLVSVVTSSVVVTDNPVLTDLGFSALGTLGADENGLLSVRNNASLATCQAEAVRDRVRALNGQEILFVFLDGNNDAGACQ